MSEPSTHNAEERFVEPSKVEPATAENAPTLGAKMFVVFFMLIVPPMGVALLAAVCWTLWKLVMAGS